MRIINFCLSLLMLAFMPSLASAQVTGSVTIRGDVRIGCMSMNGLVRNLDDVTEVSHILNNQESIWHNRRSCTLNTRPGIDRRDFIGWYDNGKFYIGIELVHFSDDSTAPVNPNKKKCLIGCVKFTNAKNFKLFRPIFMVRKDSRHSIPPECFAARTTVDNVTLFGLTRDRGVWPQCIPTL